MTRPMDLPEPKPASPASPATSERALTPLVRDPGARLAILRILDMLEGTASPQAIAEAHEILREGEPKG